MRPRDPNARLAELEAELAAAEQTIELLLDRVDGAPRTGEVDDLDRLVRLRTRALAAAEAELRQTNAELERQGTAKAEFISIVAHELRTPLTSILGYLELIGDARFGVVPDAMVRPLAALRRNAGRLQRLVDEMLDVTRIDAGRLVLTPQRLELGELAAEVVAELSPLAEAKAQRLRHRVLEPVWLDADRDKLHRIAVNLVANAVRYTGAGGEIDVLVAPAPRERYPGGWVRLAVRDNGIGLTEAQRRRIFEPFSDRDPAKHHSSSEPGSSGLGLYITRGLIELHGGLLTVDSSPGEFTEFTVLLPSDRTAP